MAAIGGSQSEAFGLGVNHPVNESGHVNDFTMGNDARPADQGLAYTAAGWAERTPQGVTPVASTGQDDSSFEQMERTQGSYQPGSMETLQDRIGQGSDDAS